MYFIGDVHGKLRAYRKITDHLEESIQVGDMAFNYEGLIGVSLKHRFLKGNHDNPEIYDPHELGDYGILDSSIGKIGFVRGAESPDCTSRMEGCSKFRDEQLSYAKMCSAIATIIEGKPSIIVTHDCPQFLVELLFGYEESTHTRRGLDSIWDGHKPKLWIFGHHHVSRSIQIEGTQFVCLRELEAYEVAETYDGGTQNPNPA